MKSVERVRVVDAALPGGRQLTSLGGEQVEEASFLVGVAAVAQRLQPGVVVAVVLGGQRQAHRLCPGR